MHVFTIATNNIKYLGVILTKQVNNLYKKNFKSLKKEIKKDIRRWKDAPGSWISKINSENSHLTKNKNKNKKQKKKQTNKKV